MGPVKIPGIDLTSIDKSANCNFVFVLEIKCLTFAT